MKIRMMLTRLIKKTQQPLLIMALLLIVIASCKKKETTPANTTTTPPTTGSYYFSCRIKGADWSAPSSPFAQDTIISGDHYYIIKYNASSATNQFSMTVFQFDPTTWALGDAVYVDNNYNMYDPNFAMSNLQLSVTKDSVNKIISGTFSFPLLNSFDDTDTIQITNGKFKVKYN